MTEKAEHRNCIIVGGGLCGLSAAYHFQANGFSDYLLLERNPRVGGLARTEIYDGFSFDHSIHILYTRDPYVTELISDRLLAEHLRRQERRSYCYTAGMYTPYPYQANNYGLPAKVVTENILGLIEARYGGPDDGPTPHFEAWIHKTFGRGFAKNFMIPYNRRQWAWDLTKMNYDWIEERVPVPDLKEVLLGALRPTGGEFGPNSEFWYPANGGIEALSRAFLRFIPKQRIRLNAGVEAMDTLRREVTLANGHRITYDWLISTVPIPALVNLIGNDIPRRVRTSAESLDHNVVHTVNVGLKGTTLGVEKFMHWVYFPEEDTIFHRISFPHRFSEHMVPPGCCSIQAEVSESVYRPVQRSELVQQTLEGLVRVGVLTKNEARPVSEGGRVLLTRVLTLDPAYIIYDLHHSENTRVVRDYLQAINIESVGRFGSWEYLNMDHAILGGKAAADRVQESCGG